VCGCTPTTCAAQGKNCGTIADSCGATLDCGTCDGGVCGAGGTSNVCGCQPATCVTLQKDCGTVSDGCGGMLTCGTCSGRATCGGGGTANLCGCADPMPEVCNGIDDDCNGLVDDGTNLCAGGEACVNAQCVAPDAGMPDGGQDGGEPATVDAGIDAGSGGGAGGGGGSSSEDAGSGMMSQGQCGCGASGLSPLLGLALVALRRRRRT
jgi:uncharacterized protein (TIGR03382 family)